MSDRSTLPVFAVVNGRSGQFMVERLPIFETPSQKLRPWRHRHLWVDAFRQQTPQLRMMPAQVMPRTIAVGANAGSQSLHLRNQRLAVEAVQIFVHADSIAIAPPRIRARAVR